MFEELRPIKLYSLRNLKESLHIMLRMMYSLLKMMKGMRLKLRLRLGQTRMSFLMALLRDGASRILQGLLKTMRIIMTQENM